MRTNRKMTVREFVLRAQALKACQDGLDLFLNKRGTVTQRIKKMCEVANRPGINPHWNAMEWFARRQFDFYDRGIRLGFTVYTETRSSYSGNLFLRLVADNIN